jgi:hypothetical protein
MVDILKNARFSENGLKILRADFQYIFKICCEFMDEMFYNQIAEVLYLVEIFTIQKDSIDDFVTSLKENDNSKKSKYDPELIKVLVKKRKALKN